MAKGANDLILRDRLQFDVDANGDVDTVYGRIDLSDYVNVVSAEGLSIKEVRYQLRNPSQQRTGVPDQSLISGSPLISSVASLKIYATTSAYESAVDVGIASPNVLSCVTMTSYRNAAANEVNTNTFDNQYVEWSTPDLHPAGYAVVTDLLIGIAAENISSFADSTLELDVCLLQNLLNFQRTI